MRDAPDAEARAQYKPRHAADAAPQPQQTTPVRLPVIQEPPIAEDDTRPRPAAAASTAAPPTPSEEIVEETAEPDFLADLARFQPPPPDYANDTQPIRVITPEQERPSSISAVGEQSAPVSEAHGTAIPIANEPADSSLAVDDLLAELDAAIADWPAESEPVDVEPFVPAMTESREAVSEPVLEQQDEPPEEATLSDVAHEAPPSAHAVVHDAPATSSYDAVTQPIQPAEPAVESEPEPAPQAIPGVSEVTKGIAPVAEHDAASLDTSQLSIWEIFGVQRPSDTQEHRAAKDDTDALEPPIEAEGASSEPQVSGVVSVDLSRELLLPPQRIGLRMHLRRSSVKLRRPE
jgi:hypothetical protein